MTCVVFFLTIYLLVSSADNLCKQFGPGSVYFGPDPGPNCLTLMVHLRTLKTQKLKFIKLTTLLCINFIEIWRKLTSICKENMILISYQNDK